MESLGGQRGIVGVLLATGAVAIPVGLVVVDTFIKWLPDFKATFDNNLGKSGAVVLIWLLMILWAFGGLSGLRDA